MVQRTMRLPLYLIVASVVLVRGQLLRNTNGPLVVSNVRNGNIAVISAEPRNGTIIKQGDSVRLSCRTNIRWFFCVWKGPGDKKQCAIQERMPQNVCQGDNRITLEGGSNNCDIILRDVRTEDYGSWMCLVTDPVKFTSDKQSIALEVGAPAQMQFSNAYGPDRTLVVTEGDTVKITCEALNAHPAPQLSWVEPQDAEVDISAQPQINTYDYTTDIRHTLKYKAKLSEDGQEIKCIGTQVSKDGRTVLYENQAVVKLKVEKLILPIDNALTQKIGIISGVLLAVIFLILLCVFLIFAVCKRRRKRSRPPSSTGTEDTCSPEEPPLKPIWTTPTPVISSNNGPPLITRQAVHHHHHHHQKRSHHHQLMSNTVSQATVSTQSTGSNGSWEDRSVGGEIEESAGTTRYQKVSPSLHETHFEDLDHDLDLLPRTVLHHPDPNARSRVQRPSYAGRPSSSMLEQHPYNSQTRPQSAMADNSYYTISSRRIPTPNGPMTTSVKSVFDCDLGCFVEEHQHQTADLQASSSNQSSPCSQTSEAKEV